MPKFLMCYPFSDPRIRLVEGFSAYDGVLGDEQGSKHNGIDYVLKDGDAYQLFSVFAMHDGTAFQGESESWGNFVILYAEPKGGFQHSTIYAHLSNITDDMPLQFIEVNGERISNTNGKIIRAGERIGQAGITGWTNDIIQLHIELHEKNEVTGEWIKLDPYGVNDRASSGKYPQPGTSLAGLDHAWVSDEPKLGIEWN